DNALAISSKSLALAERIAHPFSLDVTLLWNAMLHLNRGEPELVMQRLGTAEAPAAEQRLGFVLEPRFLRGAALSALGAFEGAIAFLRAGLGGRLGTLRFPPVGLANLAEALANQGEYAAALAAVRDGVEAQKETGQLLWEAKLHRLEGIALLGLKRLNEAQRALEEALRVARRHETTAYQLRAAAAAP